MRLSDTADPMSPCDQPNSSCSGSISTPGTERKAAAPTRVTKATAATTHAQCRPWGGVVRGPAGPGGLVIVTAPVWATAPIADEWHELPTCARIRPCLRSPVPHRVVVLAIPPVIGYDLTIPPQVLGEAFDEDGHPLYDVQVVSLDGGPVHGDPRLRDRPVGRRRGARHGADRHRPGHPDRRSAARRHAPRRPARGARDRPGRRPLGLDLHRRLRPRGGRDPRRAPGHDALEVRRRLPPPPPRGGGRRGRPLHRRRPRADLGRAERRHRPLPPPGPHRPRHRGRQRGRPPHGRAAVARRRAGAVHRAARAAAHRRGHQRRTRLGAGPPPPAARRDHARAAGRR